MANCDLCGTEAQLVSAVVEGTMLNVCKECSRFGNVVKVSPARHLTKEKAKKIIEEPEEVEVITKDYSSRIKNTREKLGIKQEDLARKINEKESLIHKIESGRIKPNMAVAKKLESALKIRLVETYIENAERKVNMRDENLTIGDLINVKQRKR